MSPIQRFPEKWRGGPADSSVKVAADGLRYVPQTDPAPAGVSQRRFSMFCLNSQPMLGAAEDGEADVAVDLEDLAAVLEGNGAAVDVTTLRIEDVAAGPAIAALGHAPEDLEAEDGLIFEGAGAADA